MKNLIAAILGFGGLILLMGVAGNDCDGACMENAMPIGDMIVYSLIGLAMMVAGLFLGGAFNAEEQ